MSLDNILALPAFATYKLYTSKKWFAANRLPILGSKTTIMQKIDDATVKSNKRENASVNIVDACLIGTIFYLIAKIILLKGTS